MPYHPYKENIASILSCPPFSGVFERTKAYCMSSFGMSYKSSSRPALGKVPQLDQTYHPAHSNVYHGTSAVSPSIYFDFDTNSSTVGVDSSATHDHVEQSRWLQGPTACGTKLQDVEASSILRELMPSSLVKVSSCSTLRMIMEWYMQSTGIVCTFQQHF